MSDNAKEQDGREGLDVPTVQFVLKEAKDLIRSLERTTISRVRIQSGALQIEVERAITGGAVVTTAGPAGMIAGPEGEEKAPTPGLMPILAPLVGVFYGAGSPGAKPFVSEGDTVERGQVVGIVEAMKVMNEVTSDYRGVVQEILVENGEAVQHEQKLMLINIGGSGE